MKKYLLDCDLPALEALMRDLGQPAFRAKQIFQGLHQGKPLGDISNIPAALKTRLSQEYGDNPVRILERRVSKDGTRKYLYLLPDSNIIEGVVMQYHYGISICVSSQVGCKMGCVFCASGENGFVRSLTAGEMAGQILAANADLAEGTISHVVVMGSGEPLDNYDELMKFIRLINHPLGVNIGARSITVSTCGLVPQMRRLAREGLQINLALSLHAPDDELRKTLLPVARTYPLDEVLQAAGEYSRATGRRVTMEYALIDGVNDTPAHAAALCDRLAGMLCHVNLIPLNQAMPGLRAAGKESIQRFFRILEDRKIAVTIRRELGSDIQGACGQLRRDYLSGTES